MRNVARNIVPNLTVLANEVNGAFFGPPDTTILTENAMRYGFSYYVRKTRPWIGKHENLILVFQPALSL